MQNLFGSAAQIKQGAFTTGPAAKRIALIDTRDMAATAVAALTEEGHAGKVYNLNGPELLDGYAQAAAFSKVLGRTVRYLDVSAEAFIGQLKTFGLPPWLVDAFGAAVSSPEIPGDGCALAANDFFWRKTSDQREGVLATAAFAATYWITQATAIAYPNTAFFDPEFLTPYSFRLGLPTQAYFEIGFLSVITLASWLALRKSAHWSS